MLKSFSYYRLADILTDKRLLRLFSNKKLPCSLNLWILEITNTNTSEYRLLYGQLTQYPFTSNRYTYKGSVKIKSDSEEEISMHHIGMSFSSDCTRDILIKIINYKSIIEIIKSFHIEQDINNSNQEILNFKLSCKELSFRPVSNFPSRNTNDTILYLSTLKESSAFSAAITQQDKINILVNFPINIQTKIIKTLSESVKLDFTNIDSFRLGDIELLVFPTLTDFAETRIQVITYENSKTIIKYAINDFFVFGKYYFILKLTDVNKGYYTYSKEIERNDNEDVLTIEFPFNFEFQDFYKLEIEIYGYSNNQPLATSCGQECYLYLSPIHHNFFSFKSSHFKTLPKQSTKKFDNSLQVNKKISYQIHDLFPSGFYSLYFPKKDNGQSDFIKFLEELFSNYTKKLIYIVDPYIDTLALKTIQKSKTENNYIILRAKKNSEQDTNTPLDALINFLNDENLDLNHSTVKIYTVDRTLLHDRYIIIQNNKEILQGYSLTRSIQKPVLKNSIVVNPLTFNAIYGIIEELHSILKDPSCQNVIDYKQPKKLEKTTIGDYDSDNYHNIGLILSILCHDDSLININSDILIKNLNIDNLLKSVNINDLLSQSGLNFSDFWISFVKTLTLSNIHDPFLELSLPTNIQNNLSEFILNSVQNAKFEALNENYYQLFQLNKLIHTNILELLKLNSNFLEVLIAGYHHLHESTPLYFALKFLQLLNLKFFIKTIDRCSRIVLKSNQQPNEIQLKALSSSLLITLFDLDSAYIKYIPYINYCTDILQYTIISPIIDFILISKNDLLLNNFINQFDCDKQISVISRLILLTHSSDKITPIYTKSLYLLHNRFPSRSTKSQVILLLDTLNNKSKYLPTNIQWISKDVILPLLQLNKINPRILSQIIVNNLIKILKIRLSYSNYHDLAINYYRSNQEGELIKLSAYTISKTTNKAIFFDKFRELL